MDIQLKRGLLETCVLAVLKKNDSYGYQIVKDLSQCLEISESTLYPILKRLELAKCLEVYTIEHNSRLRKYYKITAEGLNKLQEFDQDWSELEKVHDFIMNRRDENNYE